ncbi:MAG: DUF3467 domain-containing protein [Acidobacteria bacterium]|nr:DUF3467 domain-containing protein [Acidobacteriota bacterium]
MTDGSGCSRPIRRCVRSSSNPTRCRFKASSSASCGGTEVFMTQRKQINFTIVPDESSDVPRTYANFCAISHTPFDFTLTFCEVLPPSEKEVREAETQRVLQAPVRSRIVVPMQFVPNLINALQEHLRSFGEGTHKVTAPDAPVH